jgi:hypothetical protein
MPDKEIERLIVKMRKKLGLSALHISIYLRKRNISSLSHSGVSAVFLRYKCGPKFERTKIEKPHYYQKEHPWELIHLDEKKLPNIKGENPKEKRYSFKAVDSCTRFKFTKEYPDKTAKSASDFLLYVKDEIEKIDPEAVIQTVMTDNGKNYTARTKKAS